MRTTAAVTSGPIPSPGNNVTACFMCSCITFDLHPERSREPYSLVNLSPRANRTCPTLSPRAKPRGNAFASSIPQLPNSATYKLQLTNLQLVRLLALWRFHFFHVQQTLQFLAELIHVLEVAINRRKPYICHLVQRLQSLHDHAADFARRPLAIR